MCVFFFSIRPTDPISGNAFDAKRKKGEDLARKLCAKYEKASWVFSVVDFVLESLFCAQRLWILNLVFSAKT